MPVMTGLEADEKILEIRPDVPVIVRTRSLGLICHTYATFWNLRKGGRLG